MTPRAPGAPGRTSRSGSGVRPAARPGSGPARSGLGVTVTSTAQRFAARARARRRQRRLAVLAIVAGLAVLAWLVLGSSWLSVRSIVITGTQRVPVAEVRALAEPEVGDPMLLADPAALAARVRSIPLVAEVRVTRRWPSTLLVTVRERQPVAAVPGEGHGLRLVDPDGFLVAVAQTPPPGLPLVQVDLARAGAPALRSALAVLAQLPPDLRGQLQQIGADSADSVWFTLPGGSRVTWGSPVGGAQKVQALQAVRKARPGAQVYDVSGSDVVAAGTR